MIDRLAAVLAERGDPDPVEVRRASALRLLADPARALELLASAALAADTTPPDMPAHTDPLAAGALRADLHETEVPRPTSHLLQPVCVFNVHTTREALAAGGGASGAARVEDVGPQTLAAVRAWLGDAAAPMRIRVRPVLDPTTIPPVDRYEIPAAMRQAVEVLNPYEVFPYGTLPSSRCDGDHVAPYRRGPDGEPAEPGQTRWEGLAATSRFHHRLKTHGRWRLYTPEPGEYWWRTPQGHWFQVGPAGTRHHGRDPACDRRWLQPA